MKEPWFWREKSLAARAATAILAPAAFIYDQGQRLRAFASRPANAGASVICVGNASLGGVGKTPFALMLRALLKQEGVEAHFLSRGHGGRLIGPVRVAPEHGADEVGDEPLLLAADAPTWIAKSKLAGARAAASAGAEAIIMDDGFQNPTVRKDVSFLLIDAANPDGNGRIFPAGPMREPLARAAARADAIILVGEGPPPTLGGNPLFRARTRIRPGMAPRKAVAFCGIGRPERFFRDLEAEGFTLAGRFAFPDHHRYLPGEIERLRRKAAKADAALITTEKDLVRLSPEARVGIATARLEMTIDDPQALVRLVLSKMGAAG